MTTKQIELATQLIEMHRELDVFPKYKIRRGKDGSSLEIRQYNDDGTRMERLSQLEHLGVIAEGLTFCTLYVKIEKDESGRTYPLAIML